MAYHKLVTRFISIFPLDLDDIVTERWTVHDGKAMVQWLDSQSRWIDTGEHTWRYASTSRGHTDLEFDPDSGTRATLRRRMTKTNRYLVYLGLVFFPISLLVPSLLFAPFLLYPVVGFFHYTRNPLEGAPACQRSRTTNHIFVLLLGAGILSVIRDVAGHLSLLWNLIAIVGTVLFTAYWAYGVNGISEQSDTPAFQFLRIPLVVFWPAVASLGILFYMITPTAHMIHIFQMWLAEYGSNPLAMGSIISGFTAGAIRNNGLALFIVKSDPSWFSLPILFLTFSSMFLVNLRGLKRASALSSDIRQLCSTELQATSKFLYMLCIYPVVVGAGLVVLAMEATIIWYGMFDSPGAVAIVLSPLASLAPPDLPQTPSGVMEMIYVFIVSSFSLVPIEVSRPMAAGLLIIAMSPLGMIIGPLLFGLLKMVSTPLQPWKMDFSAIAETLQDANSPTEHRKWTAVLYKPCLVVLVFLPGGAHILSFFSTNQSSGTIVTVSNANISSGYANQLATLFYPSMLLATHDDNHPEDA